MLKLSKEEEIKLCISDIRFYSRLYKEERDLGVKDIFLDYIHHAQMDLVNYHGYTWRQVELIAQ